MPGRGGGGGARTSRTNAEVIRGFKDFKVLLTVYLSVATFGGIIAGILSIPGAGLLKSQGAHNAVMISIFTAIIVVSVTIHLCMRRRGWVGRGARVHSEPASEPAATEQLQLGEGEPQQQGQEEELLQQPTTREGPAADTLIDATLLAAAGAQLGKGQPQQHQGAEEELQNQPAEAAAGQQNDNDCWWLSFGY